MNQSADDRAVEQRVAVEQRIAEEQVVVEASGYDWPGPIGPDCGLAG